MPLSRVTVCPACNAPRIGPTGIPSSSALAASNLPGNGFRWIPKQRDGGDWVRDGINGSNSLCLDNDIPEADTGALPEYKSCKNSYEYSVIVK